MTRVSLRNALGREYPDHPEDVARKDPTQVPNNRRHYSKHSPAMDGSYKHIVPHSPAIDGSYKSTIDGPYKNSPAMDVPTIGGSRPLSGIVRPSRPLSGGPISSRSVPLHSSRRPLSGKSTHLTPLLNDNPLLGTPDTRKNDAEAILYGEKDSATKNTPSDSKSKNPQSRIESDRKRGPSSRLQERIMARTQELIYGDRSIPEGRTDGTKPGYYSAKLTAQNLEGKNSPEIAKNGSPETWKLPEIDFTDQETTVGTLRQESFITDSEDTIVGEGLDGTLKGKLFYAGAEIMKDLNFERTRAELLAQNERFQKLLQRKDDEIADLRRMSAASSDELEFLRSDNDRVKAEIRKLKREKQEEAERNEKEIDRLYEERNSLRAEVEKNAESESERNSAAQERQQERDLQMERIRREMDELQQKLELSMADSKELHAKYDAELLSKKRMQEDLVAARDNEKRQETKLRSLATINTRLEKELELKNVENTRLGKQLSLAERDLASLQIELGKVKLSHVYTRGESKSLDTNVDVSTETKCEGSTENTDATVENSDAATVQNDLLISGGRTDGNANLQERLRKAGGELLELRDKTTAMETDLAAKNCEIAQLKDRIFITKKDAEFYEKSWENGRDEVRALTEKVQSLELELHPLREDNKAHIGEIGELKKALEAQSSQREFLQNEKAHLENTLEETRKTIEKRVQMFRDNVIATTRVPNLESNTSATPTKTSSTSEKADGGKQTRDMNASDVDAAKFRMYDTKLVAGQIDELQQKLVVKQKEVDTLLRRIEVLENVTVVELTDQMKQERLQAKQVMKENDNKTEAKHLETINEHLKTIQTLKEKCRKMEEKLKERDDSKSISKSLELERDEIAGDLRTVKLELTATRIRFENLDKETKKEKTESDQLILSLKKKVEDSEKDNDRKWKAVLKEREDLNEEISNLQTDVYVMEKQQVESRKREEALERENSKLEKQLKTLEPRLEENAALLESRALKEESLQAETERQKLKIDHLEATVVDLKEKLVKESEGHKDWARKKNEMALDMKSKETTYEVMCQENSRLQCEVETLRATVRSLEIRQEMQKAMT